MQKDIHPKYNTVKIKIGEEIFETMSCYDKGDIVMDKDFRLHPAWTKKGVNNENLTGSSVGKFNKKFKDISF